MNHKRGMENSIDYADFANCYVGLATMIFVQADNDLRSLNGQEIKRVDGGQITRGEILCFLRSEWAKELASCLDLTSREFLNYRERASGYGR